MIGSNSKMEKVVRWEATVTESPLMQITCPEDIRETD
jgi:hypothetical protein